MLSSGCSNIHRMCWPARAALLALDATSAHGVEISISSPADGHTAVGLSFTGLVGLVSALAWCISPVQGSKRQL